MKIALAQTNPIIGDFEHNFRRLTYFAEKAAGRGCDLIVFPELSISGYPPRDLLEKEGFVNANLYCLEQLVQTVRGIGVICGYVDKNPHAEGNTLYNAAVLFEDGRIHHKIFKQLLPTYDIFDEGRYFEPGSQCAPYTYKGRCLGITICEDIWNDEEIFPRRIYHVDPMRLMVEDGADVLINISASPFTVGKKEFRWRMLGSIARKYHIPFIYTNQVGGNDSVLFDGVSTAFSVNGQIVARARDFEEDLVTVNLTETGLSGGECRRVADSDTESILKALIMGTHDYVKKCGFSKVVVGLSGGIDSALTACIAVEALNRENVTAVFMPSRYTSRENHEDTRQLAENLGIEYVAIPIDDMFAAFLKYLSPDFDPGAPGVVEQNIQARIRGTVLMGLSNKHGSILLSTGNKSELAVGYCTLYGDMNGGLSVISDVPKTTVYELSRFINRDTAYIPRRIIDKPPSAELGPGQLDQDDLPPYEVLDPILKGYIEETVGVEELVRRGFDRQLVADIVGRVDRNEYKRHQAAPGLKVTSKAFGYGRRYPLAQRYTPR